MKNGRWSRKNRKLTFEEKVARARKDPMSLGSLLVDLHRISPDDLEKAIDYQRQHADELLGETLVKLGLLDRDSLELFLNIQKKKKTDIRHMREILLKQDQRLNSAHQGVWAALKNLSTVLN